MFFFRRVYGVGTHPVRTPYSSTTLRSSETLRVWMCFRIPEEEKAKVHALFFARRTCRVARNILYQRGAVVLTRVADRTSKPLGGKIYCKHMPQQEMQVQTAPSGLCTGQCDVDHAMVKIALSTLTLCDPPHNLNDLGVIAGS